MQRIFTLAIASVLLAVPVASYAQMTMSTFTPASVSVMPVFYSTAPAFMIFTLHNPSGTESVDFGDGQSTGTQGCTKNALGWCDLSGFTFHRYDYPGRYTATLYAHYAPKTYTLLSTTTITVLP
jgi:hypothetical protein